MDGVCSIGHSQVKVAVCTALQLRLYDLETDGVPKTVRAELAGISHPEHMAVHRPVCIINVCPAFLSHICIHKLHYCVTAHIVDYYALVCCAMGF